MDNERLETKIDRVVRLARREEVESAATLAERRLKGRETAGKVANVLRSRWPSIDLWLVGSMAGDGSGLSSMSGTNPIGHDIHPPAAVGVKRVNRQEIGQVQEFSSPGQTGLRGTAPLGQDERSGGGCAGDRETDPR